MTQDDLASKLGIKRGLIGSYEEGRAAPKLPLLQQISGYFGLTLDSLVNSELWNEQENEKESPHHTTGKNLRVLATVTDREEREQIMLVPIKASAGYTNGYADPDFIENLPVFSLPLPELEKERTYRAFQIKGDSMEPVKSGSYILCGYLQNWLDIKDGKPYIVVTKDEGVVYKRLFSKGTDELLLKSDNPEYSPYSIQTSQILEVWSALGYICFELPEQNAVNLNNLQQMVLELRKDLKSIKENK